MVELPVQRIERCVGTAPDNGPCRLQVVRRHPLPLCDDHYTSSGLRQYHHWLTRGPEEVALEAASFHGIGTVGIDRDWSPEEKVAWILRYEEHRREQEAMSLEERRAATVDRERSGSGLIYFIRSNLLVKIGKSINVEQRLEAFSDPQLELLATEPGYTRLESQLHSRFEPLRVRGEWFRLEAPLTDYIRGLPGYKGNLAV